MAEPPAPDALSITDLYAKVDRAVRGTFPAEIWITGEIRSIKVNANGHCFIDLVDPGVEIGDRKCVGARGLGHQASGT